MLKYILLLASVFLLQASACKKDPCEDINCENGGECVEGSCECLAGFVGVHCEVLDISSFLGNYTATYNCGAGVFDSEVGIGAANNGDFELLLIGLGDYDCPSSRDRKSRVFAHLEGQTIQIPAQTICAKDAFKGYNYRGSGHKQGDSIKLYFSVIYETGVGIRTDSCHVDLSKK